MKETEDRRTETEENKISDWSMREFEVSPKTDVDCARFQTIVDYKGVACLFTHEYSDPNSVGIILKKQAISQMINKLNSDEKETV